MPSFESGSLVQLFFIAAVAVNWNFFYLCIFSEAFPFKQKQKLKCITTSLHQHWFEFLYADFLV